MTKKIFRCFIILGVFLCTASPLAFAQNLKSVEIPELGTVNLPADIEVTEQLTNKGSKMLTFLMKDQRQDAYRSLNLMLKGFTVSLWQHSFVRTATASTGTISASK